jgi:hypothetical protein
VLCARSNACVRAKTSGRFLAGRLQEKRERRSSFDFVTVLPLQRSSANRDWREPHYCLSRRRARAVFGSVPLPWPVDDVDPVGLDRPLALASLLVTGCRAGLVFWCSLSRRAWVSVHCRFSAPLPTLSSSAVHRVHRAGSIEPPCALQHLADRSACSTSLEVCFPSAPAGRVAPSAAAGLRTIPLRRSRPPRGPPEVGATARRIFVLAVLSPCAPRAPGPRRAINSTIHTGPVRVIAPRSLFRAAFRYPIHQTLSRLGRTCWCVCAVRQRSWDFLCPSQFSLTAGPRISAVHPHLPFRASPSHTHPLIFTGNRSRI